MTRQRQEEPTTPQTSTWEWLVAALGLIVTLAMIAFMVREAVNGPSGPPDVVMRTVTVTHGGGGYLVSFQAENRGGRTAAGVIVEGTLEADGEEIEASETELDYLPARSSKRGGLWFREDPRRYRLELRARGYEEP